MAAPATATERLTPEGTRVIVISAPQLAGVVSEVRREPHLKTYVVRCDDGTVRYASPYELALEGDAARTPLGPRPEY